MFVNGDAVAIATASLNNKCERKMTVSKLSYLTFMDNKIQYSKIYTGRKNLIYNKSNKTETV